MTDGPPAAGNAAAAAERPAQADQPPPPIRWWTLAVGVALALAMAAAIPVLLRMSSVGKMSPTGFMYLPVIPMVIGMLLAVTRVMRPRECMLCACLMLTIAGVVGSGLATSWSNNLVARPILDLKPGAEAVAQEYPARLSLPSVSADRGAAINQAVDGLVRGHRPLGTFPVGLLAGPVLWTGLLIVLGLVLVFALAAVTTRQWTHHERLQHPLADVQASLFDRFYLRQRPFLVAFAGVLAIWLWNLAQKWDMNPLPPIASEFRMAELYKLLGMDAGPGEPRQVLEDQWGAIKLAPIAIGVAFLLSLEMGFSVWSGFWLGVVAFGWLYAAGMPVSFPSHGRLVGCGAMVAMAAFIVFLGRHHYWTLLCAAGGRGRGADDRIGIWGMRFLIAASAGLIVHLSLTGGSVLAACLGVGLAIAYLLTIARVVAETGLPMFQSPHHITAFSLSLGLPMILPSYKAVIAMHWLGLNLFPDTRENIAGFAAQAGGVGARQRLFPGRLLIALAALAIVGSFIALGSHLISAWTGAGGIANDGGVRPLELIEKASQTLTSTDPIAVQWWRQIIASPAMYGIGLVITIAVARRLWTAFPFHPLGIVVAFSWPIWSIWGSLMVGWLAKLLVMRYGGSQLYARLKPVAMGLIAGDLVGFAIQFIGMFALRLSTGHEAVGWR